MKILIVEDDMILAADIREILEGCGCLTFHARTYGEAISIFNREKPDAVFMDITLNSSVLNGIQIAEEIRKKHAIPIVFITAHSDKQTLLKAYETKPFQYIVKPYNETQIKVEIERIKAVINDNQNAQKRFLLDSEYLVLPDSTKRIKIIKAEIVYVKSFNGYLDIFTKNDKIPLRNSIKLKDIVKLLPENQFFQIDRSHIINLTFLKSYEFNKLILNNTETQLELASTRKEEFEKLLPIVKTRM